MSQVEVIEMKKIICKVFGHKLTVDWVGGKPYCERCRKEEQRWKCQQFCSCGEIVEFNDMKPIGKQLFCVDCYEDWEQLHEEWEMEQDDEDESMG